MRELHSTEFGRRISTAVMVACLTLPVICEAQVFTNPAKPLNRPKISEKSAEKELPRADAKPCNYSVRADGVFSAYEVGPGSISRQAVSNEIENVNLKQGLWQMKVNSPAGRICYKYERIDAGNDRSFIARTLGLGWECIVTCGAKIPAPYVVNEFSLSNGIIDVRLNSSIRAYKAGVFKFDYFYISHNGDMPDNDVSGEWISE